MINEKPIAVVDAVKISYAQKKDGMFITFSMNPTDPHRELAELPLGSIVRLYVTEPDMGA